MVSIELDGFAKASAYWLYFNAMKNYSTGGYAIANSLPTLVISNAADTQAENNRKMMDILLKNDKASACTVYIH